MGQDVRWSEQCNRFYCLFVSSMNASGATACRCGPILVAVRKGEAYLLPGLLCPAQKLSEQSSPLTAQLRLAPLSPECLY